MSRREEKRQAKFEKAKKKTMAPPSKRQVKADFRYIEVKSASQAKIDAERAKHEDPKGVGR